MGASNKPPHLPSEAEEVLNALDRSCESSGVTVTTTEDMSIEEQEFELTAGFLKEGYSLDVAKEKSRQWRIMAEEIFKDKN